MKKKGKKFEFQNYLIEQGIDRKDLPKKLAKMIKIFEKHQKEVIANCDYSDCLSVYSQINKFADFIMNEIFEFVEERSVQAVENIPNEEAELELEKEQEAKAPTNEEILAELYSRERTELSRTELESLGFTFSFDSNTMDFGEYRLARPLMHSNWIISKTQIQEG